MQAADTGAESFGRASEAQPEPEPELDRPGDPVCWLSMVCPHCGAMMGAEPPAVCPQCQRSID